tara:strand:+ start:114 stop:386 length:273 start_codon:yes stop_codon:yes gene_type:complete
MAIQHKWYMCGKDDEYIYETNDNKKTIYRRSCEASLEDNDYTNRELVFGERELGTVADDSIIKELCERHVNYFELGSAVAKYYRDNILNQ